MSTSDLDRLIRDAFKSSNVSRVSVGLRPNKKPPTRYRITMWLDAGEYLELVHSAFRAQLAVGTLAKQRTTGSRSYRVAASVAREQMRKAA